MCDLVPPLLRTSAAERLTAVLRRTLLDDVREPVAGWLLDLCALHGLAPLDPDEARAVGEGAPLWRYLHSLGHPVQGDPRTSYEKLLLDLLTDDRPRAGRVDGPTVAQSMLIGGAGRPGEGASGGLGVFLRSLGDALADRDDIGRVVTIVLAADPTAVVVERQADREHWTVHVPVDSPVALPQPQMGGHRIAITWWIRELLTRHALVPDVVHVRYSDDGSLAVADAARLLGARVVFTLTPDPHRHLAERYPEEGADEEALRFDLHRVRVADELVERADALVAIGGRGDELVEHFPQLGHRSAIAIEEGIAPLPATPERPEELVAELFAPARTLPRLDDSARGLPMLLNVGRLHPVKQQTVLVRAWLEAGLHTSTALVLIGGSLTDRTPDERAVLDEVLALAESVPEARGRLAVLPAWPNAKVRGLEHALATALPAPSPHVYACASVKEEFGIAVLEAMEAGLLVVGPVRGGLPHYVDHGRNGFLVDTSTAALLGAGLREAVELGGATRAIAEAGRETVRERFPIARVAGAFARVYRDRA
ncbi:glycosyltransferase family 4 protein [Umezawaea sp. NPDC059074]|uniref:glycosyltransferase family 4 protein n=1 Tax=Umezawaea sp. NPDC059074 TaxID=3346716 RepID=UPI0036B44E6D